MVFLFWYFLVKTIVAFVEYIFQFLVGRLFTIPQHFKYFLIIM